MLSYHTLQSPTLSNTANNSSSNINNAILRENNTHVSPNATPISGVGTSESSSQKTIMHEEHRRIFNEKLHELVLSKSCDIFSKENFDNVVNALENTEDTKAKNFYNIKKNYALVNIGGEKVLTRKNEHYNSCLSSDNQLNIEKVKRMCYEDQVFDFLYKAHINTGHAKGKKTYEEISLKVSNVSRAICDLFASLCSCSTNRKVPARPEDFTPIYSSTLNSRGQMDLIDMQSAADGEWRWILNYQDHLTKFLYLRALRFKTAIGVAHELLKIFLLQGILLIQ